MKRVFAYAVCGLLIGLPGLSAAGEPFGIRVVDSVSGRGVPLVELETVNHIRFVTDSAGWIAFAEPGLMNSTVFFSVRSHGYTFPKDGFGFVGKALTISPGGSATLKIKRVNIAERLCRLTGGGIYRDSVLLGKKTPLRKGLLNGRVFGQDSAQVAVYRGRAYWFWVIRSGRDIRWDISIRLAPRSNCPQADGSILPAGSITNTSRRRPASAARCARLRTSRRQWSGSTAWRWCPTRRAPSG